MDQAIKRKKIYISGGITGVADHEKVFAEAEKSLSRLGFAPISPEKFSFDGFTYQDYIAVDLAILSRCDGVYMLTGWTNSKGARLEHNYAEAIGVPVYYSIAMLEKEKASE